MEHAVPASAGIRQRKGLRKNKDDAFMYVLPTRLPICLGMLASAAVALALCPVPRSTTLSAVGALFLALAYVLATAGIGAAVFAACGVIVGKRECEVPVRRVLPFFCCVAAWISPLAAFYARDSLWAVLAGLVLSILVSCLIYRYYPASRTAEMLATSPESPSIDPHATRRIALTFAALLLQFGVLSTLASMAHSATILISCAIVVISFFHQSANQTQSNVRFPKTLSLSMMLGLAIILVAASMTPYLEFPTDDASSDSVASSRHSTPMPRRRSAKANLVESARSWFQSFLPHNSRSGAQRKRAGGASPANRPYPALQALFGEGNTAVGSESNPRKQELNSRKSTALLAGDSEPGVILRPKVMDHVTIVPPPPTRRVFDAKPSWRTTDPVSIPFYGAYWIFKASDKTLPAGAIDVRGDPDSLTFRTTDFSPISMEARQNFGSSIQLSCCGAIELVISNADRRPGTVRVELILTNTSLPGQPGQSLGVLPVDSTLHWFPGDDRPPVTEVLSFRLPAQPAIQSFDEATIRFEMRSPRERFSAKIAVEKFRLIPRLF